MIKGMEFKMKTKFKIAIIEDDIGWQDYLYNCLSNQENYDIIQLYSISEAKEWLYDNSPCELYIIDYTMDRRTGYKFRDYNDKPKIYVTGDSSHTGILNAFGKNVIKYFIKDDFDKFEFIFLIKKTLETMNSHRVNDDRSRNLIFNIEKNYGDVATTIYKNNSNYFFSLSTLPKESIEKFLKLNPEFKQEIRKILNVVEEDISEIRNEFEKLDTTIEQISEQNGDFKLYLDSINQKLLETPKNDLFEVKLKAILPIFPELLHLEFGLDIKESMKRLANIYDKVSLPAYQKLMNFYHKLKSIASDK